MPKKPKVQKKYLTRISKSTQAKRKAEIRKRILGKVPKSERFKPLPGDSKKSSRRSTHTISLTSLRKEISKTSKTIKKKDRKDKFILATSRETGVPARIIRKVYERGEAAWGIGHRVGVPQAAWAKARVYSFLNKGKTTEKNDKALYLEAKKLQKKGKFKLK